MPRLPPARSPAPWAARRERSPTRATSSPPPGKPTRSAPHRAPSPPPARGPTAGNNEDGETMTGQFNQSETTAHPKGPRYPQVRYTLPDLDGPDGNVFAIIGAVARLLRAQVGPDAAAQFTADATSCQSYQQVLDLVVATVTTT